MRFVRVHRVWASEGHGLISLTLSVGSTFVLGLALQLVAIRHLAPDGYSTFVLALGIGNVAAAVAGAIQPVSATHVLTGAGDGALPLPAGWLACIAIGGTLLAAGALSPQLGFAAASLAVAQLPLHAIVAVGMGELQGRREYLRLAIAYSCFAVVRLGFALLAMAGDRGGETAFVAALPAGLLATIALVGMLGGYRQSSFGTGGSPVRLAVSYTLWAVFAWLLNADAIAARLVLPSNEAGQYALAVTLGRQALYAILPLSFVLLPATQAGDNASQRTRLLAIMGVSAVVLMAAIVALGVAPSEVARLVSGHEKAVVPGVLRGYAVVGSLGALATLEFTFLFALGKTPRLGVLTALTACASGLLMLASSDVALLAVQLSVITGLAVWLTLLGFEATKAPLI